MPYPLISIIIPCYNHGRLIDEAIQSVELYPDKNTYEIIIINDGSTDDYTNQHLDELKNKGYHVVFQENQGLGKTRNNGISLARGKYILPLDADNKIRPEYISKAIEVLEKTSSISVVYSDRQLFGNSMKLVKVGEFDLLKILEENYIDACAIFRKTMWEAIGGYDENMPAQGLEDWDFWLAVAEKNGKFYYLPEPLFFYRVIDDSMLHQLNAGPHLNKVIDYIYKKHALFLRNSFVNTTHEMKAKINDLQGDLDVILRSRSYKICEILIKPFRMIRKALFPKSFK